MKIRDIMSQGTVVTVEESDDLALATQTMVWAGVHHLPVLRDGKVIGLLTERDVLAHRAAAAGPGPVRDSVFAAMTPDPQVITPDEEVVEGARLMAERHIGCLPVVEGGRLVAVVTATDLLGQPVVTSFQTGGPTVASEIMQRIPVTAAADDHLMDAVARMSDRGVRHLPVVDGERKVVGMLSDRDIRTAIGDPMRAVQMEKMRLRLQAMRVSDVMSTRVLTVSKDAPLTEVAARLVDRRIGALPVVDALDRLVGIISYVDVIRAASFPLTASAPVAPAPVREQV